MHSMMKISYQAAKEDKGDKVDKGAGQLFGRTSAQHWRPLFMRTDFFSSQERIPL
jgi:hypothetical protein